MGDCALPCPLRETGGEPGDIRILRRVKLRTGPTGQGDPDGPYLGLALDCETTGLSQDKHRIIELGLRRFHYDDHGVITYIGKPYAWLEDPGHPLTADITRLTGLTDDDLAGQLLDDDRIDELMLGASIRIAHNARFDRGFVEQRLPPTAGRAWACSCDEVPWRERGFDGAARNLGWLLAQAGLWHEGHRAGADVDAVIALMMHRFEDGRTALSVLLENSTKPSWLVRAEGADFGVKDALKARGYRWDADRAVWGREVTDDDRTAEECWLAEHVYSSAARPRSAAPTFTRVTNRTRHATPPADDARIASGDRWPG